MSRPIAFVLLVSAALLSVASAEWWAVSLEYKPGFNCDASGLVSASIVKNDTCLGWYTTQYVCTDAKYMIYGSCDGTQIPSEFDLNNCLSNGFKRAGGNIMYKCVEAPSEAEALSFMANTTEIVYTTVTNYNSVDSCAGSARVEARDPACMSNAVRKRTSSAAYSIQTCNSTHTLSYDCDDSECKNCVLSSYAEFSCNAQTPTSSMAGCIVIPALQAPVDSPVAAPVAVPVANGANPVASPQGSVSTPVAAPSSAAQVAMSMAVFIAASVLVVLF